MTVKSNRLKWTKKGLKAKTAYKACVKAWVMKNGKKKFIKASPIVHAYTSGGNNKYTNPKSVTVKKANVTLKKGRTFKITATVKKLKKARKLIPSTHAAKLRYLSSNTKIARVTGKGRITAVAKGTCKIYVLAANGLRKTVTVKVR